MVTERNSANVATQVSTYTYDCFDKRISKQVDTTPGDSVEAPKQWFAYDGANVRLEFIDTDGSGAQPALMTTRYFNGAGIDNIIEQENYAGSEFTTGSFWLLKDRLGSTTDLEGSTLGEGSNQQQSNSIEYDSFGTVLSQTNASVGSRYMYTGREFDSETGEQYNRARYYDSSSGRFISEDPLFAQGGSGLSYGIASMAAQAASLATAPFGIRSMSNQSSNLYVYTSNNPISFVDPLGLRGLTPAEKSFVKKFFGKCLDPNQITITGGGPNDNAVTIDHNSSFPGKEPTELDLNNQNMQEWFAHELWHIVQYQTITSLSRSQKLAHDTYMVRGLRAHVPRLWGQDPYALPADLSGFHILDTRKNFESGPQAVGKAVAGRNGFQGIMDKLRGLCGCGD